MARRETLTAAEVHMAIGDVARTLRENSPEWYALNRVHHAIWAIEDAGGASERPRPRRASDLRLLRDGHRGRAGRGEAAGRQGWDGVDQRN